MSVLKDKRKYIFCGNRPQVLNAMLDLGLDIVDVLVVQNSYLLDFCNLRDVRFTLVESKKEVVERLKKGDYDIFVSNGCPYILPISNLSFVTSAKYVNVHPSLLPDLRGCDPVPGAILFGHKSGVTCHIMNDKLDAGDIISRIEIGETQAIDVTLLYQLSFRAEYDVFCEAWKNEFRPIYKQSLQENCIYYTFKPSDLEINWSCSFNKIVQQIKAFNNRSKGCFFVHNKINFKVYDAEWVSGSYISKIIDEKTENEVVFVYEKNIAVAKDQGLLLLKQVEGDLKLIRSGDVFCSELSKKCC